MSGRLESSLAREGGSTGRPDDVVGLHFVEHLLRVVVAFHAFETSDEDVEVARLAVALG